MIRLAFAFLLSLCVSAQAQLSGGVGGFPGPGTAHSSASAPTLDGSATSGTGSSNTKTVTLTTTNAVNEIIVIAAANSCTGGVDTPTATSANLTFTRKISAKGGGNPCAGNDLIEFYAQSSSALTSEVITVTISPGGSVVFMELIAFGVKGIKTSAPFDTNVSLPAVAASGALNMSTTNATDFMFACFRGGGPPTPDAGWTTIINGSFMGCEYQRTTVAQTGLTPGGSNGNNGAIGDAIVSP